MLCHEAGFRRAAQRGGSRPLCVGSGVGAACGRVGGMRAWVRLAGCLACGVVHVRSGATRRREREFPGWDECCWLSVAMRRIATKSLLI